jgi:hypothetical protein
MVGPALLLGADGSLSEPMLYLSLRFKIRRQEYYEQLQPVRETGNWKNGSDFFYGALPNLERRRRDRLDAFVMRRSRLT